VTIDGERVVGGLSNGDMFVWRQDTGDIERTIKTHDAQMTFAVNSLVVLYFMWITHKKKPLRSKFTVNTN
jgi:hypothetical protein